MHVSTPGQHLLLRRLGNQAKPSTPASTSAPNPATAVKQGPHARQRTLLMPLLSSESCDQGEAKGGRGRGLCREPCQEAWRLPARSPLHCHVMSALLSRDPDWPPGAPHPQPRLPALTMGKGRGGSSKAARILVEEKPCASSNPIHTLDRA